MTEPAPTTWAAVIGRQIPEHWQAETLADAESLFGPPAAIYIAEEPAVTGWGSRLLARLRRGAHTRPSHRPATPLTDDPEAADATLRPGFVLDLRRGSARFDCGAPVYRFGPPSDLPLGAPEIARGDSVVEVTLCRDGQPVAASFHGAVAHSLAETEGAALAGARFMLPVIINPAAATQPSVTPADASGRLLPLALRLLVRLAWQRLVNKVRWYVSHEQWAVGIARGSVADLTRSPPAIDWIDNSSPDSQRADPFGIVEPDGSLTLLLETVEVSRDRRGVLEATRWPGPGDFVRLLDVPRHLSYPSLLLHDGAWLCVPEDAMADAVTLYRFEPDTLALEALARWDLGGPVYDPTLLRHDGRWWLFGTRRAAMTSYQLYCWHADSLDGDWQPHAANPVANDIRCSRQAGAFLRDGERLLRPAQDCAGSYGAAVRLFQVDTLTPLEYSEHEVAHIEPAPDSAYPAGLHTLNQVGEYILLDGKRRVFSRSAFLDAVRATFGASRRNAPINP